MYRIKLSDGTEYPVKFCSASNGVFIARLVTDASFVDIATAFSDVTKTDVMQFLYDSTTEDFEGYTDLFMVNANAIGEYTVWLRKAVDNGTVS